LNSTVLLGFTGTRIYLVQAHNPDFNRQVPGIWMLEGVLCVVPQRIHPQHVVKRAHRWAAGPIPAARPNQQQKQTASPFPLLCKGNGTWANHGKYENTPHAIGEADTEICLRNFDRDE